MAKRPRNVFTLKTIGNDLIIKSSSDKESVVNLEVAQPKNLQRNVFVVQETPYKQFDDFFATFQSDLLSMNLTEANKDKFYNLSENLVKNFTNLCMSSMNDNNNEILQNCLSHAVEKLEQNNSTAKRLKQAKSKNTYVPPQETGIGVKWKTISDPRNCLPDSKHVQTTYSYVPIVDTIRALFSNPAFYDMYFEYNENSPHICTPGVYEDFCCGSTSKKHSIFKEKSTIQLQIGIDDFEPCSDLKSKTGLHKQCAIYFQIRNLPQHIRSKLNNIFVIALVPVLDLNDKSAFDNVLRKIVAELKIMQTGIRIGTRIIKGVLINISGDNLGANGVLGFVECFSAQYYCRICESNKFECKLQVREDPTNLRNESNYSELLSFVEPNKDVYIKSKGIKKYCLFNDLETYSIFANASADILHDILEGVVSYFLSSFLNHLIKNKITTEAIANQLIRDYNYGNIWSKYKPSVIKPEKKRLNQSAMQLHCLIIHLPLIFIKYRPKVVDMWNALEELLRIIRIVFSHRIRDSDIERLKQSIEKHLTLLLEIGLYLLPKHHFLLHYPTLIKRIGPLLHAWMMRFESKHKTFADFAKQTCNFMNLSKTLVNRHQIELSARIISYEMKIVPSITLYDVTKCVKFDEYSSHLLPLFENDNLLAFESLMYESIQYRPGLLLVHEKQFLEIMHLFEKNQEFFVFCSCYSVEHFHSVYNCVEIKLKPNIYELVNIKNIAHKKTLEKKISNKKMFVIAESLEVFDEF